MDNTPTIHIHAPEPSDTKIVRIPCSRVWCSVNLPSAPHFAQHYEWYGWYRTCLMCGDEWSDGYRIARPFARGWRRKNIEDALKRAQACGLDVRSSL
jgi:hypothetical protein